MGEVVVMVILTAVKVVGQNKNSARHPHDPENPSRLQTTGWVAFNAGEAADMLPGTHVLGFRTAGLIGLILGVGSPWH